MAGAVRYAVNNGAANALATWDGGTTFPSAGDTVYANGKNVTFYTADFDLATGAPTVNATALIVGVFYVIKTVGTTTWTSVGAESNTVGVGFFATAVGTGDGTATAVGCITNRSLASPVIAVGGTFQAGDGRIISAVIYGPNGTSTVTTLNYTGYYSASTINGDIYQGTGSLSGYTVVISSGTNFTLIVNGSLKRSVAGLGVQLNSSSGQGSLILNGNIEGNLSASRCLYGNYFNLTINGTITGGTATASSFAAEVNPSGTCTIMGPLVNGIPTAPTLTAGNSSALIVMFSCVLNIGAPGLIGTITGGSFTNSSGLAFNSTTANPIIFNIYANIYGGSNSSNAVGFQNYSGRGTINGNLYGVNSAALLNSSTGIVTINGNIIGSSVAGAATIYPSPSNLIINGNVYGSSINNTPTINETTYGSPLLYTKINGDVIGGTGSASHGINQTSPNSVLIINGNAIAANNTTGSSSHGLSQTGGIAYVNNAVGSNTGPSNSIVIAYGVFNNGGGLSRAYVRKTQQGTAGWPATIGMIYRWADNTTYTDADVLYSLGTNYATFRHRRGDSNYVPPAANQVRAGVKFCFDDETGTMIIPNINSVRKGVNVDTTQGIAVFSTSDVWNSAISTTAISGGLFEIIKKSSTIEIASAITASYER